MQDMAFSYHENHPSLMNLAYLPSEMPLLPQQIGDMAFFLQNYSSGDNSQLQEDSSTSPDLHCFMPPLVAEPIQDKKAPNQQHSGEKKRKINKDEKAKGVKTSKQKKASSGLSEAAYRKEELSAEYIPVRARRGEATDSHSLAERIRREKISERMKVLQSLVPGCEKVTGKALMLDEIINYVQSLQNQVEFLSMRLASLNPVLYFGADLDDERVMRTQVASIAQSSHLQPVAFSDGTANCPMIGQWAHCFPHGQGAISLPQDYLMQLDSQRQGLLSQTGDIMIKACSFQ